MLWKLSDYLGSNHIAFGILDYCEYIYVFTLEIFVYFVSAALYSVSAN